MKSDAVLGNVLAEIRSDCLKPDGGFNLGKLQRIVEKYRDRGLVVTWSEVGKILDELEGMPQD